MIEVVPAAEEDEFVPPLEIGKLRDDSEFLDYVLGKGSFFFEPRVIAGFMSYRYQETYNQNTKKSLDWEGYMPFLGAGIILGYKNFSLDLYARRSAFGKDNQFDATETPGDNGIITNGKEINVGFLHHDYGINLNYQLSKKVLKNILIDNGNIIFSVGYKWGINDIREINRNDSYDENICSSNQACYDQTYKLSSQDKQFKMEGITLGVAYGYSIENIGILGINLAYAWLDTEYSSSINKIFNTDTAKGETIGIQWNGIISNNLTYGLSVDYYKYNINASSTSKDISLNSITETVLTTKASLSYTFDLF
jgi:hypothetical protein